jgi:hypothetical protein
MILFLILACIFLIFGAHQNWDRHTFNNILGLVVHYQNSSGMHTLCHSSCITLGTQKLWNEHAQTLFVHTKNEPKTLGANRPPPLLLGSSSSQLIYGITVLNNDTMLLNSSTKSLYWHLGSFKWPWRSCKLNSCLTSMVVT